MSIENRISIEAKPPRSPRRGRWGYLAAPGCNPPSDICQKALGGCEGLSKVFNVGSKTVFDEFGKVLGTQRRWKCSNGHQWLVLEAKGIQGE